MSFVRRGRLIVRALLSTYASWRAVPVAIGGAATLLAVALLAPPGRALAAVVLAAVALVAALVLFSVEIGRQDRLRSAAARSSGRSAPRPRAVPARSSTPAEAAVAVATGPLPPHEGSSSPAVTVVVTAHNEAAFVEDCLRSIADQTWEDFECVLVDDLSTDSTLARAAALVTDDARFRLAHCETNRGLAGARNVGTALARGRWITFVDADDYLYPGALASRVEAIVEDPDEAWVAGAYCLWHSVPESGPRRLDAPTVPPRGRVSWVDVLEEAPFIASAPLLRTSAVRAVGGFDESLVSAEDYEFWSRLLRQGWVLNAASEVGIAYRQKARSMFRVTGREHASTTTDVYRANQQPLGDDVQQVGPHLFRRPGHVHRLELGAFRRQLVAAVSLVAAGGEDVWGGGHEPWMLRAVDVETEVRRAARRQEADRREGQKARVAALVAATWKRLGPALGLDPVARRPASEAQEEPASPVTPAGVLVLDRVTPLTITAAPPRAPHVLLGPASAYHVDEMGPLAAELRRRGHDVGFLLSDRRYDAVATELRKYHDFPAWTYAADDPAVDAVARSASAFVVLNDWGEDRAIIERLDEAGIPTFAKIEGVQDFQDADVHWERGAYTHAAHRLCQGPNDVANTAGERHVVGSTRLERIWQQPVRRPATELVVINLNFTYGVLAEARDPWLASVLDACRSMEVPYTISRHPAERSPIADPNVATEPMRHLLTRATLLVSRFSTVPFEAMARGVPFAYHNPHLEKVPTFHEPEGAFPITYDADELRDAIRWSREHQDDYRDVARDFFLQQVDVDPTTPSEVRTADVIESVLAR